VRSILPLGSVRRPLAAAPSRPRVGGGPTEAIAPPRGLWPGRGEECTERSRANRAVKWPPAGYLKIRLAQSVPYNLRAGMCPA